jgi:integrase
VRLLFTDENFTVAGHPVVGVPFLLDKHMEVVEAASSYLLYVSLDRGRTRSPQTWRNHGEALYDYFSWLEANEVDWRQGCRESRGRRVDSAVAAYRNWSISVLDPESGQCRLKRSTVNQRLTCLIGFYRWAEARGLIDLVPWLDELRASRQRPADFMRHARGSTTHTSADDLKLRTYVEPPKLLSQEQCKRLMSARMSYTQRLMIALMLQTGLRNEECRTFPRAYVFNPSGRSPRERIRVDLRLLRPGLN